MKLIIITLCLCVAYAFGDVSHILPKNDEQKAEIIKQALDVGVDGTYNWEFETSNNIKSSAQGQLNNPQTEEAAQVAQGQASWQAPNGEQVSFSYVADENGYQVQGSHLPTPPPIPADILRALEFIRAHPPPPEQN